LLCRHATCRKSPAVARGGRRFGAAEHRRAQVALRHRHYSQASRTLEDALKRFPGSAQLRLELGRVYVYQRQDARALEIFRVILRDDPSNREAKLELARVLSYDGKYEPAAQLFRELLATNPNDEAAAIGLVGNLLFQKKKDDARREVELALARHPNSLRLQEYRDDLLKNHSSLHAPVRKRLNQVQSDVSYSAIQPEPRFANRTAI